MIHYSQFSVNASVSKKENLVMSCFTIMHRGSVSCHIENLEELMGLPHTGRYRISLAERRFRSSLCININSTKVWYLAWLLESCISFSKFFRHSSGQISPARIFPCLTSAIMRKPSDELTPVSLVVLQFWGKSRGRTKPLQENLAILASKV